MYSKPTIGYSPDYKSFKFTEKNEGMKEEKAHNKSSLEDPSGSNLKSKDCATNGSEESREKKNHFPTKDDSMDYESPELLVFLQESNYNFVKDICINNGVHSHGKCSLENCELDHQIISCIIESDANSKKSKSKAQPMVMLSSESKTTNEHNHHKNGSRQKESSNPLKEGLDCGERDESSTDHSTDEIVHEVQKAVLTSSMVPQRCEKHGDNSQTSITTKEVDSGKNSCDSDLSTTTSGTEGLQVSPQRDDIMAPISAENESTSHTQQNFGAESRHFSSGRFSAHISHHGAASPSFLSVSHRSNSSTTSSQSFAFPILAPEWHGSPERMATPEKEDLRRKRQGMFARFLCCKF